MKAKKKRPYNPYPLIVNAMRLIWFKSPMRTEALNRTKAYVDVYNKDKSLSKRKKFVGYKCERCEEVFLKLEVHHTTPVGNVFDLVFNEAIKIMFCSPEELLCLCKQCHLDVHKEMKGK